MHTKRTLLKLSGLLVALVLAGAVLGGLPWTHADVAVARKGIEGGRTAYKKYGSGGYKPCRQGCQVKRCRKSCNKARRTCIYCAKQDGRERLNTCKSQGSGAAIRECKQQVKTEVRADARSCKGLTGQCGGCCKTDYGSVCTDSFNGTSGFGGYFRTVKRYGKVHRYVPECDGEVPSDGAGCAASCERTAAKAMALCLRGSKRGGTPEDCAAAVEQQRQACLTGCGAPPTTTTTTTTTTLPSGSPKGALLHP